MKFKVNLPPIRAITHLYASEDCCASVGWLQCACHVPIMRKSTTLNITFAIDFHYIDYVWHTHSYCKTLWYFKKVCQRGVHSTHGFGWAQLLLVAWHPHSCRSSLIAASSLGFFVFFASGDWRQMLTAVFRCSSFFTLSVQATSPRRTYAPRSSFVVASSLDFFRFSRLRWLSPVAHSSFPLSIVFSVVGPGHITSENELTRVPVWRRVVTRFFPLFSPQVTDASCP